MTPCENLMKDRRAHTGAPITKPSAMSSGGGRFFGLSAGSLAAAGATPPAASAPPAGAASALPAAAPPLLLLAFPTDSALPSAPAVRSRSAARSSRGDRPARAAGSGAGTATFASGLMAGERTFVGISPCKSHLRKWTTAPEPSCRRTQPFPTCRTVAFSPACAPAATVTSGFLPPGALLVAPIDASGACFCGFSAGLATASSESDSEPPELVRGAVAARMRRVICCGGFVPPGSHTPSAPRSLSTTWATALAAGPAALAPPLARVSASFARTTSSC
mmetsp:Transcript_41214/g.133652  ORF Transcript_41214/g.133652 Transcript_41214/m.133652 type:complete len:277 (+) Transcript_41214:947-1777(+)